jgi:hypothetical protein
MDKTTYTCQCVINAILEHYCKINYGSQEDEINTKLITMGKYLDVESYARFNNFKILEQIMKKLNYNKTKNITLMELERILHNTDEP